MNVDRPPIAPFVHVYGPERRLEPIPEPNMHTTEEILEERARTHGQFAENARIAQSLKRLAMKEPTYYRMDTVACESLDMIMSKIARILSSNEGVHHLDNWADIAGYARLVEKHMVEGGNKSSKSSQRFDYSDQE